MSMKPQKILTAATLVFSTIQLINIKRNQPAQALYIPSNNGDVELQRSVERYKTVKQFLKAQRDENKEFADYILSKLLSAEDFE